jgi:hypothetical protein
LQVAQDNLERAWGLRKSIQGFLAVAGLGDAAAGLFQNAADKQADARFIIHNQNSGLNSTAWNCHLSRQLDQRLPISRERIIFRHFFPEYASPDSRAPVRGAEFEGGRVSQ